jgi:hypothetical protein
MRAEIRKPAVWVYGFRLGEIAAGQTIVVMDILGGMDLNYHRNF